jgi:hypothetical protein
MNIKSAFPQEVTDRGPFAAPSRSKQTATDNSRRDRLSFNTFRPLNQPS